MSLVWLEILTLYLVILGTTRALIWMPGVIGPQAARRPRRSAGGDRLATAPRPIEVIAADLRRLGVRYRHPCRGTSYAKLEALRFAYDHALAEMCAALEIEHLLAVLPPGPELDAERKRVEDSLWLLGLRFEQAS